MRRVCPTPRTAAPASSRRALRARCGSSSKNTGLPRNTSPRPLSSSSSSLSLWGEGQGEGASSAPLTGRSRATYPRTRPARAHRVRSWSNMICRRCRQRARPGAAVCPKCGGALTVPAPVRAAGTHPILDAIARTAAHLCATHDAQIVLVEGETLRLVAQHGPPRLNGTLGEPFPLSRGTVYGRAALERRVIQIRDLKVIAQTQYPDFPGTRIRTMLAAPLLSGD